MNTVLRHYKTVRPHNALEPGAFFARPHQSVVEMPGSLGFAKRGTRTAKNHRREVQRRPAADEEEYDDDDENDSNYDDLDTSSRSSGHGRAPSGGTMAALTPKGFNQKVPVVSANRNQRASTDGNQQSAGFGTKRDKLPDALSSYGDAAASSKRGSGSQAPTKKTMQQAKTRTNKRNGPLLPQQRQAQRARSNEPIEEEYDDGDTFVGEEGRFKFGPKSASVRGPGREAESVNRTARLQQGTNNKGNNSQRNPVKGGVPPRSAPEPIASTSLRKSSVRSLVTPVPTRARPEPEETASDEDSFFTIQVPADLTARRRTLIEQLAFTITDLPEETVNRLAKTLLSYVAKRVEQETEDEERVEDVDDAPVQEDDDQDGDSQAEDGGDNAAEMYDD